MRKILLILYFGIISIVMAKGKPSVADAIFTVNNTWMLVSTFFSIYYASWFFCTGNRANSVKKYSEYTFKNVAIIAIGILTYAFCGFNLMYPGDFNGYFGFAGFGIKNPIGSAGLIDYVAGAYTYFTDFIFQAMFAATAATIVSGAVAERVKLSSFLIFSLVYVALIYPVAGSWKWGGGWLDQKGFYDFCRFNVGAWSRWLGRPGWSMFARSEDR